MYTLAKDISTNELVDIIKDDIIDNDKLNSEKTIQEIHNILSNKYCVYCGMIYYNCLCSHDN